jgi:hypothetical protein
MAMGSNFEQGNERWSRLKDMLDSYFYLDPSSEEPLADTIERVKADNPDAYLLGIRADIEDVLRVDDNDLGRLFEGELRSYYDPGGDGLTPRAWLALVADFLAAPRDTTRDHRSGMFSP